MTAKEMEVKLKALEAKIQAFGDLQARVQRLEDIENIKKLQRAYGYYLEHMMVEDVLDLFADGDNVELWVAAGKFKGKGEISRLYHYIKDSFPGTEFLHQIMQLSGVVDIDPDGKNAKGRWYGFGANAIPSKGGKISPGWMNGVYEVDYIKQDFKWKIKKLRWCMTFCASWTQSFVESSRRDDSPMDRPQNENLGPRGTAEETRYPSGFICPFHFTNPVSGRKTVCEEP
jgi:hypothetical protein